METILKDIRFGARMLVKNPGLTAIAVVALTLGIGLTTTMFSIVNGALLEGLPFEEADRVMHLERNNLSEDIESMEVTIHDYLDWREQQGSFVDIAAFYQGTANVSGNEGRPERYDGAFITAGAFPLLRVRPLLGRVFEEGEDSPDAEPVVLIGHAMWQNRFDSDPDIVGKTALVNSETMTVIGVMPEGFEFPILEDLWIPLRMNALELERGDGTTLEVLGRLKNGISIDQAQLEFSTIAKRLALAYPETNEGVGAVIKPYTEEYVGAEVSALLYTMLATVFGVLLIACANVANLLLARAAMRSKEVAIRSALGASRIRVITQLLAESFVLSAVGGLLGLGLAWVGVSWFARAVIVADPPFWLDFRIDPMTALFVTALTLITSVVSGIIPAIKASGASVHEILKDESRGTSSFRIGRLSRALVIGEIAVSCGLLVAAGLMIKSVTNLRNLDLGFETEKVLTARVGLFEAEYPDTTSRHQFFQELTTRLEALPGGISTTMTNNLPGLGSGRTRFAVEGEAYETERDHPLARRSTITPDYFSTFGVSVLSGRSFAWSDNRDALPVAVVNEMFIARHFAGDNPIGKRVRLGGPDSDNDWLTIVGVVPDLHMAGVGNDDTDHSGLYIPLLQSDARFMSIAVRTSGPPLGLASEMRDAVMSVDADMPIYWVKSMTKRIDEATWFYGVFGTLFVVFGFAALFLASVGLYGVMAFSVSRRTQEVGVRMALGAQTRDVLFLVLRQGLVQLGIGLTAGFGLAALLANMMKIVLFRVEPMDTTIFLTIPVVLIVTGLLACLVPARRATRVDPMVALQYD